jgi:hypothetical protein
MVIVDPYSTGQESAARWVCFEVSSDLLRGRGWIRGRANHDVRGDAKALDG